MKNKRTKKFNYAVGQYWQNGGSVGVYNYFGEVHWGTLREAQDLLKYVKTQDGTKDYKIFQLVELPL